MILFLVSILISVTFLIASIAKVMTWHSFTASLGDLGLPFRQRFIPAVSGIVVIAELSVAILIMLGNQLRVIGFVLGLILLMAFTGVLVSVLWREVARECNCFGVSERPINNVDVVRNLGLCACCVTGIGLAQAGQTTMMVGRGELELLGAIGILAAVVWSNLGEIYSLLRT